MINLQPFCSTDETRFYLMKPFTRGGFTYATDGIIMVRVAERTDIPDVKQKFNQDAPLKGVETATFFRPAFELPPAPTANGKCTDCDGRGYDHDCPDCECICDTCHGSGNMDTERAISTVIGPKIFNLHYARMMLSLPGIEIEAPPEKSDEKPLLFRFDEGVGALMPMKSQREDHVDIKLDRAA